MLRRKLTLHSYRSFHIFLTNRPLLLEFAKLRKNIRNGHSWIRLDIEFFQGFISLANVGINSVCREMKRNARLLLQTQFGFLLIYIIILLNIVGLAPFF